MVSYRLEFLVLSVGSTAAAPTSALAAREMLSLSSDPSRGLSVADFWHEATRGEAELSFRYAQPVALNHLDQDWWALARPPAAPGSPVGALRTAVTAILGGDLQPLREVTGVIILSSVPPQWYAVPVPPASPLTNYCFRTDFQVPASGGLAATRVQLPVTFFSTDQTHAVLCHEVGHAMGIDHTFGLPDARTEYGAPTCIMSTARWSRSTGHRLTQPVGTNITAPAWWTAGGPDLSRASMYAYVRDSAGAPFIRGLSSQVFAPTADTYTLADRARADGHPEILVFDDPEEGAFIVELRQPRPDLPGHDWDAGIGPDVIVDGNEHGSQGVIVHRLADGLSNTGAILADQPHVVGTIPLPLGAVADVELPGTLGRRLRVERYDLDRGLATLSVSGPNVSSTPRVRLDKTVTEQPSLADLGPTGRYEQGLVGAGCGRGSYSARYRMQSVIATLQAHTSGLETASLTDTVAITWTISGLDPSGAGAGSIGPFTASSLPFTHTLRPTVKVGLEQPESSTRYADQGVRLALEGQGSRLLIVFPPGDGTYTINVQVSAQNTETGVSATTTTPVTATTAWLQWESAYYTDRGLCDRWLAGRIAAAQALDPDLLHGVVLTSVIRQPVARVDLTQAQELIGDLSSSGLLKLRPVFRRPQR